MEGGWFKVPNAVLDQFKTIGPLAFGVFCTLAKHANAQGVAWPSIRTIAANLGMAHRSVMRAISALETCGLVRVVRETADSGSRAPNRYRLTPQLPGDTGKTGVVTPGKHPGDTGKTGVVTPEHTELDPIEQDPLNKTFSPPKLRFEAGDLATAEWMFSLIRKLSPAHKPPRFSQWANEVRLMRERDGRTDQEIRELFGLANADGFWSANILSPGKLREKWDQLTIKLKVQSNGRKPHRIGPGQRFTPGAAERDPTIGRF